MEELKQRLRQRSAAQRTNEEIKAPRSGTLLAKRLPGGRDLEFWLRVESEIKARERQV
jgi:hypothetical protein